MDSCGIYRKYQVKEYLTPFTPEQIEEHVLIIQEDKSSHDFIRKFHEWLFTSTHPEPLEDAEANKRNNYLENMQTYDPTTCYRASNVFYRKKNNYCKTVNAVKRHTCIDYCEKIVLKEPKKG